MRTAALGLAVIVAASSPSAAYEYRFRWVERVGSTDVVIGACGASLDIRSNTGPRTLRLEVGVFDDASGPAPAGGLLGVINGVITVSGPAANSQDRRTPGRLDPFTWFPSGMANGDPPAAGGPGGPDAADFDFQSLHYIYASLGVQTLHWGCDANGTPFPQPSPAPIGRNTYAPVYEVTTDPVDANTRSYAITFSGEAWSVIEWRVVGHAVPPDCKLGVPGYATYSPLFTGRTPFDCSLRLVACETAPQIVADPAPILVSAGDAATFSVEATGPTPLSYQWRRNGAPLVDGGSISGAATPTLTIDPVSPTDHGAAFSCLVSDACDDVTSAAATLTVCDTPAWSALGAGLTSGGSIHALAVLPNGNVVAGGAFTEIGGVPAANIARWDGVSWRPLGEGTNGPVYALAVPAGGDLVAGGSFTLAGGSSVERVARWNGTAWQPLGAGAPGTVRTLTVHASGDIISGGAASGDNAGGLVQRWDGISWTASPLLNGVVRAVEIMPTSFPYGESFVGGAFTAADRIILNGIGRLASVYWFSVGAGMNGPVHAVASRADGSLFAAGSFTTAGGVVANSIASGYSHPWRSLSTGTNAPVLALDLLANGDLVAGGLFTTAGGAAVNRIARWNGSTWRGFGDGMDGPVNALAQVAGNSVIAGGEFSSSGGVPTHGIARWSEVAPVAAIAGQPLSADACLGETVSFEVTVAGDPAPTYRWRKGGVELALEQGHIHGVNSRRLIIIGARASDAGVGEAGYDCVVFNSCGTTISERVNLVVCAPDFNCSGALNSQDFFDFVSALFANQPRADFNENGAIDSADFFDFIAAFLAGC